VPCAPGASRTAVEWRRSERQYDGGSAGRRRKHGDGDHGRHSKWCLHMYAQRGPCLYIRGRLSWTQKGHGDTAHTHTSGFRAALLFLSLRAIYSTLEPQRRVQSTSLGSSCRHSELKLLTVCGRVQELGVCVCSGHPVIPARRCWADKRRTKTVGHWAPSRQPVRRRAPCWGTLPVVTCI